MNEQFDFYEPWKLPHDVVREVAVRDSYLESKEHDFGSAEATMYRMHLLVDQSAEVRSELAPWLKQIIVGLRLFKWGAFFAIGFVCLCISTVVLKILNHNRYVHS